MIQSRNTSLVKSAFVFEVCAKYTSSYFEVNQYLFDLMFSDEPLFEVIKVLTKEASELLKHSNKLTRSKMIQRLPLFSSNMKQEPASGTDIDPSNSAANKIPTLDMENSRRPTPKKRFKVANQESAEDLLDHSTEISTKRSTKWAVSTLKGMCHSFAFLCSCLLLYISGNSNVFLSKKAAQFVKITAYEMT